MAKRWKKRPDGSNWGDFGGDDQLGRVNLLTPEKVKQGIAEVRDGRTFCLSLRLDLPGGNKMNPRRHAPQLRPTELDGDLYINYPYSSENGAFPDIVSDDCVLLWTQYSTQWDSFAHIGQLFDADGDGVDEIVYYNGYRGGEDVVGPTDYLNGKSPTGHTYHGADALGIHNFAEKGMQGRAVMFDLHAHFGDERVFVGYDELMRIAEADNVSVEAGDMVCFHTGLAQRIVDAAGAPDPEILHGICPVLNGRDERLLQWITDSDLVALCADNYAVEGLPALPGSGERHAKLPLHEHCLFKLGIPLGELWYFSDLAAYLRAERRNRFFLTAPPLRLPGAVGSPATPIATV